MEILLSNINVFLYSFMYIFLLVYVCRKKEFKRNVNAIIFILAYYSVTSFFSLFYFNASNGVFRDYRNVSLLPYVYLVACFILTVFPIYAYDKNATHFSLILSERKRYILKIVIILVVLCTLLPFFESILQIPAALAADDSMAAAYDARLSGHENVYLSSLGRKFFAIIWMLNNVIPVLIFIAIINKIDKKLIIGLLLAIVSIWISSMILGGRSKLVQNALYVVVVYFLFRKYLSPSLNKKLIFWGSLFLSIAILAIVAVSVSRYNSFSSSQTSSMSIWSWLGLYAGEGALNFNCLEWYAHKSPNYINGYATLLLPLSIISGNKITVAEVWNMKSRLGIPGNIFYTYVGTIMMDWGKIGTILLLLLFSFLVYFFVIRRRCFSGGQRMLILCLWSKILVVGPIFFTYATYEDQVNLVCSLIFGVLFL